MLFTYGLKSFAFSKYDLKLWLFPPRCGGRVKWNQVLCQLLGPAQIINKRFYLKRDHTVLQNVILVNSLITRYREYTRLRSNLVVFYTYMTLHSAQTLNVDNFSANAFRLASVTLQRRISKLNRNMFNYRQSIMWDLH